MEPRLTECIDPQLGSLLDSYIEGTLDADRREAVELHYFRCAACLGRLQLHQDLAVVVGGLARRRSRLRVWVAATTLAAAAGLGLLFLVPLSPERPASPMLVLLDGTLRSVGPIPQVPAGRPIDLRLRVPVPEAEGVRYSIRILEPAGALVFSSDGLPPSGPNEVQVTVPHGLAHPGRHDVVLEERVSGDEAPLSYRFSLEVTEPPR